MSNERHTAEHCIAIAKRNVENGGMVSSAKSCLADAERFASEGRFELVPRWAMRSLAYSVGIFGADYQEVRALIPAEVLRYFS